MERIGAGFIAILASLFFAMFDITASLLVLLGFLIFRWAVIAAPILGTVGLLRPASSGLRRLANAVVAAVFNIVIFGTGAAIYLFAVDLIMSTASLPGWLQVVLVWLPVWSAGCCCGRTGGSPSSAARTRRGRSPRPAPGTGGSSGTFAPRRRSSWSRRAARGTRAAITGRTENRPESRTETVVVAGSSASGSGAAGGAPPPATDRPETGAPKEPVGAPSGRAPRRPPTTERWTEPDHGDGPPSYTVYRPDSGDVTSRPERPGAPSRTSTPR